MNDLTAILILGENRNGTTWLGNTLHEQFEISIPHHPLHFGLIETSLYSLNEIYKKLESAEDKKIFLTDYTRSDVFNSLEANASAFANEDFETYYDLLIKLLVNAALTRKHKAFAIKLEPRLFAHEKDLKIFISKLKTQVKVIKPICIQRDSNKYLHSSLSLFSKTKNKNKVHNKSWMSKMILTARYKYYYNKFHSFVKKWNGMEIDFRYFEKNQEASLLLISKYLELNIQNNPKQKLVKNSSSEKKQLSLSTFDKLIISFVKFVPFVDQLIIKSIESIKNKSNSSKYIYYRIDRSKNDREALIKEFKNSFEEKLIQQLESEF